MVQAVDLDICLVDQLRQTGIRIEAHAVDHCVTRPAVGVGVLDLSHALMSEILPEAAAQCHVQDLLAAADAQRRQVIGERPACQRQLGPVTRSFDDVQIADRLLVILAGRDVGAARKDDPIEPLVDGAQALVVIQQRDQHRGAASGHQRAHVALINAVARRLRPRRNRQCRQANERRPAQLVKSNALSLTAGTRDAPRYSLTCNLVDAVSASVPLSASRMLCVKRKSLTGRVIFPFSIRKVPSRVMPVMIDVLGWTTRTYQKRVTQMPRLMSLARSALAADPGFMNKFTANGPSVLGAGRP